MDERRKFEFKCSENWNGKFRQVNEVVSLVAKLRKREILFSGERKTYGKLTQNGVGVSSYTCLTREVQLIARIFLVFFKLML